MYWFNHEGYNLTYEDIRFRENYFDELALHVDSNCFSKKPSRTPELTNIGSFEKCRRLIDGEWWMYKNNEYFSELFSWCSDSSIAEFAAAVNEMLNKNMSRAAVSYLAYILSETRPR